MRTKIKVVKKIAAEVVFNYRSKKPKISVRSSAFGRISRLVRWQRTFELEKISEALELYGIIKIITPRNKYAWAYKAKPIVFSDGLFVGQPL